MTGVPAPATGPLTPEGVEVLLVYGAKIKVARDGRSGIRVTAGYHDGAVLLEAINFDPRWAGQALVALDQAVKACRDAGLVIQLVPHRMSNFPARIIHRRPL